MEEYMIREKTTGKISFVRAESLSALTTLLGRFKRVSITSDCRVFIFEHGSAQVWANYLKPYLFLNR